MIGLDLIGAGEGLSTQTVMLRIRSIDPEKLRQGVTQKAWGHVIPMAISAADTAPQFVYGAVLPVAKKQLEDIGINADLSTTKSPPPPNPPYEWLYMFLVGGAVGAVLALFGKKLYTLATR